MVVEALGFAKSERRRFNDAEYVLSMAGDTESLSIDVEHAEDGRRWRSRFSASFVEEITRKTGNAKKFDVFVRMLLSALAQESESVYLDILTARDLEMLRRHANPQGPPTANPVAAPSDKRYVILTYRAEFDKVHYPLPLPPDERSQEDVLRGMVGRLKSELAQAHETIAALQGVPAPIEPDKEQLHLLQIQNKQLSEGLQAMQKEAEQLRAELRLRQGQQNHARDDEVLRLRNELTRCKGEVKSLKDELKQRELAQKRAREKEAAELRAERQKADRLQSQLKKMEEEKRSLATRLRADRSRPASRTPSAERTRPVSRPASTRPPSRPASRPPARADDKRPSSRASSLASSRERTPSPSSFLARGRPANGRAAPLRPDARRPGPNPAASPGRNDARSCSPGSTLSPYRRPAGPSRSRERTPSPQSLRRGPPHAGTAGSAFSLRERHSAGAGAGGPTKPVSTRYGGAITPTAPVEAPAVHQPGSLFAVAADLGLGTSVPPEDEACDIDARLQALQSFLKQTKNIAA
ncbi:unnamed protein product [Durusdinium trenchii]|uniref:Coiled-coil domain-containing protein 61 n=1 Tax=Durusdinium trenchii TaxID=1381693 RepID=A0ABP0R7Z6_9DINO